MKRLIFFLVLLSSILLNAAPSNIVVSLTQPDKTTFHATLIGDEFDNRIISLEGFTIIKGDDDWFYYGIISLEKPLEITPSNIRYEVGKIPEGIYPDLKLSPNALLEKRLLLENYNNQTMEMANKSKPQIKAVKRAAERAGFTGVTHINNIVILVRCQDQTEFTETREQTEARLNSTTKPSVKGYFKEQSYDKFTLESKVYPLCSSPSTTNKSVVIAKNYGYFQKQSASNPEGYPPDLSQFAVRDKRRQEVIRTAINATMKDFAKLNYDANDDDYIDLVTIIFRGEVIEVSGDLLYPLLTHAWDGMPSTSDGKYFFSIPWMPEKRADLETLCHELTHSIGRVIREKLPTENGTAKDNIIPDIYRYSTKTWPVWTWDTMGGYAIPPSHMGAYMKYKYTNWIGDIPVIQANSGWHELKPMTSPTGNCFRINTKIPGEFYVLEYRKKEGAYEAGVPGSGLIVTRINQNAVGLRSYVATNGQTYYLWHEGNGYGWNFGDEIWVYRPGGNPGTPQGSGGTNGEPNKAFLSYESGRTSFKDGFLSDGSAGELNIGYVGEAKETIKFYLGNYSSIEDEQGIDQLIKNKSFISSPNPFNPTTEISFKLNQKSDISLTIYNAKGELVKELLNSNLQQGTHSITFDGSALNSGIYFAVIKGGAQTLINKLVLLK